jgi:O-antigen ligase
LVLNPVNPRRMPSPFRPPGGAFGGNQIAPTPNAAREVEGASPLQAVAFRMALALVFIYFSNIHQLLTYVLHVNLYLLYLFGIPALLGVVLAGGVQRTLRGRPAIYWIVFVVLMIAGVPFSSWRSGSVHEGLIPYLRTVLPMLFIVAGVTFTWRECRSMMWAIASGGVVIMSAANLFQDTGGHYGDRLAIEFGTISNSNDYAVHLLFVLPFVIWVALAAKSKALKLAALGMACFGILLVLKTASRGAFIGLAAGALYWLFRGTMRQRIGLLALGPIMALALVAFVPRSSLVRIVAFSADEADAPGEAIASTETRRYLLKQSVVYSLEHPIFGVGLAQFGSFEGGHNAIIGDHGMWHDTHNSYTQISSECGLPALAFYLAATLSTFFMANRAYRQAGKRTDCQDIRTATFCIMLAMATYCTGILFVNFGYFYYLPLMSSLVIAVSSAADAEFARRSADPMETEPYVAPQRRRFQDSDRGSGLRGGRAVATTKNIL